MGYLSPLCKLKGNIHMIEEIIESIFNAEIPSSDAFELCTSGYMRIKAVDFDVWNSNATIIAKQHGIKCDDYTYAINDIDDAYVWVKIEHDFISGDIFSVDDAISQGMVKK